MWKAIRRRWSVEAQLRTLHDGNVYAKKPRISGVHTQPMPRGMFSNIVNFSNVINYIGILSHIHIR